MSVTAWYNYVRYLAELQQVGRWVGNPEKEKKEYTSNKDTCTLDLGTCYNDKNVSKKMFAFKIKTFARKSMNLLPDLENS